MSTDLLSNITTFSCQHKWITKTQSSIIFFQIIKNRFILNDSRNNKNICEQIRRNQHQIIIILPIDHSRTFHLEIKINDLVVYVGGLV